MVFGSHFIFDGVDSRDYDLLLCSFDGAQDEELSMGLGIEPIQIELRDRIIDYGGKWDEVITFEFAVAHGCSRIGEPFSRKEIREIASWLTSSKDLKWLSIYDEDDTEYFYYCRFTNIQQKKIGGQTLGLIFEVTCDSPFAYSDIKTKTFLYRDFVNYQEYVGIPLSQFFINNDQILDSYCYGTGSSDIQLKNYITVDTTNRESTSENLDGVTSYIKFRMQGIPLYDSSCVFNSYIPSNDEIYGFKIEYSNEWLNKDLPDAGIGLLTNENSCIDSITIYSNYDSYEGYSGKLVSYSKNDLDNQKVFYINPEIDSIGGTTFYLDIQYSNISFYIMDSSSKAVWEEFINVLLSGIIITPIYIYSEDRYNELLININSDNDIVFPNVYVDFNLDKYNTYNNSSISSLDYGDIYLENTSIEDCYITFFKEEDNKKIFLDTCNLIITDYTNNQMGDSAFEFFKTYELDAKNFFQLKSGNNYITMKVYPEKENILARLIELDEDGGFDLSVIPTIILGTVMKQCGWTNYTDDEYATMNTCTYSNEDETIAMNFTPIVRDKNGEWIDILTPDELTTYAESYIAGTSEDYNNIKVGKTYTGSNAISLAVNDAEEIHELHEKWYSMQDCTFVPWIELTIEYREKYKVGVL